MLHVIGAGEQRIDVPVAGAVEYMPKVGDKILVVPFEDNYCCIGTMMLNSNIKTNEKYLSSNNGYIHIKDNGDVVINGLVITKNGVIKE